MKGYINMDYIINMNDKNKGYFSMDYNDLVY